MLPMNTVESLSTQTQGVGRWKKCEETKCGPPHTHNPTNRPFFVPAFSKDFTQWSKEFREGNHCDLGLSQQYGPVTLGHAIGEYLDLANSTQKTGSEIDSIRSNILTPGVFRYWSGVYIDSRCYVPENSSELGPTYLDLQTITKDLNVQYSSNPLLSTQTHTIFLVLDYSKIILPDLDFYHKFVNSLFEYGEAIFGPTFYPGRDEVFWLFHAVILNDFNYEGTEKQKLLLSQSCASRAITTWKKIADRKGGPLDHAEPYGAMIKNGIDPSKAQPETALILPDCAHHMRPIGALCHFTKFVPKLLGCNRYNDLVWKAQAELAWRSISSQRLDSPNEQLRPAAGPSMKELATQLKSPDTEVFWAVLGRARTLWEAEGDKPPSLVAGALANFNPWFPAYLSLFLTPGKLWLPMARPRSDSRPPFISFAASLQVYHDNNGTDRTLFTQKTIKGLWRSLPWHPHQKAWAEQQTKGELVERYFRQTQTSLRLVPRAVRTISGNASVLPNANRQRSVTVSNGITPDSSVSCSKRPAIGLGNSRAGQHSESEDFRKNGRPASPKRQRIETASGPSTQPSTSSLTGKKATFEQMHAAKCAFSDVLGYQKLGKDFAANVKQAERNLRIMMRNTSEVNDPKHAHLLEKIKDEIQVLKNKAS
ncbi:MAG: hypothetical protein M1812_004635 [Candelaria pacifica]|nr:MAG: hypothetical protein M1812_004635 [Candelaria pacifica]